VSRYFPPTCLPHMPPSRESGPPCSHCAGHGRSRFPVPNENAACTPAAREHAIGSGMRHSSTGSSLRRARRRKPSWQQRDQQQRCSSGCRSAEAPSDGLNAPGASHPRGRRWPSLFSGGRAEGTSDPPPVEIGEIVATPREQTPSRARPDRLVVRARSTRVIK